MPQPQQKKKKGHAPAHQNKFAFYHNPGSKKTAAIAAMPIKCVCRRCHDKLVWRKQYRKYKPRTQPGFCNHCQRRNVVTAAYHTICEHCSRHSEKSRQLVEEWNNREGNETLYTRACAICVKEPAEVGSSDSKNDVDSLPLGRISLRQRKAFERQKEREHAAKRKTNAEGEEQDNGEDDESESKAIHEGENEEESFDGEDGDSMCSDSSFDEDDPFLKAVGGKLLTGEAYQQMLMKKAEQEKQESSQQGQTI